MGKNKPTKNEHYIPQFYLKNFTEDNEHIYQYDVQSENKTGKPVPIKSICYKKDLYEFKNETGELICQNIIEDKLSCFEGDFAKVLRSIIDKSQYEKNYETLSFLKTNEKLMLMFFISTIILRNPKTITAVKDTVVETLGNQINDNLANNIALQNCLPIYKTLDQNERNLLNHMRKAIDDMSFQIVVSSEERIYTSDSPVILLGDNQTNKPNNVILPISPKIVLVMKKYEKTKFGLTNRLVRLESKDIDFLNAIIVTHCQRWIYSKTPFTKEQIQWIVKKMNNK